jgi:transcriptional regulator with XRE-family HTH domain
MKFGRDQLRDWIERRQVNQREAAELLSITDVFLSQILNNVRTPGLANAVKIERLTGIPVESWLLTDLSESATVLEVATGKRRQAK